MKPSQESEFKRPAADAIYGIVSRRLSGSLMKLPPHREAVFHDHLRGEITHALSCVMQRIGADRIAACAAADPRGFTQDMAEAILPEARRGYRQWCGLPQSAETGGRGDT